MASGSVTSRVAVLGFSGTGKQTVVRGLFEASGLSAPPNPRQASLALSNKYYDVELDICVSDDDTMLIDAEAVILVVSATHDDFIAQLEKLVAPLASRDEDPQLVIVLSNKADIALGVDAGRFGEETSATDSIPSDDARRGAAYAARLQQLDDWALDRGFEHVACCALSPRYSANTRDKAGLARVIEALSSVVWKAAHMRPRSAAAPGSGAASASSGDTPVAAPAPGGVAVAAPSASAVGDALGVPFVGTLCAVSGGAASSSPAVASHEEPHSGDATSRIDAMVHSALGGAAADDDDGGKAADIARLMEQVSCPGSVLSFLQRSKNVCRTGMTCSPPPKKPGFLADARSEGSCYAWWHD